MITAIVYGSRVVLCRRVGLEPARRSKSWTHSSAELLSSDEGRKLLVCTAVKWVLLATNSSLLRTRLFFPLFSLLSSAAQNLTYHHQSFFQISPAFASNQTPTRKSFFSLFSFSPFIRRCRFVVRARYLGSPRFGCSCNGMRWWQKKRMSTIMAPRAIALATWSDTGGAGDTGNTGAMERYLLPEWSGTHYFGHL